MFQRIIVTGGAGFIGSTLIRQLISETETAILNIDNLTYSGNLLSLTDIVLRSPRHQFKQVSICDKPAVEQAFLEFRPDAVMHLAAETHVDRSIDGPAAFLETNIVGTYQMLETALAYWQSLDGEAQRSFRFHHISTDEVFGSLGPTGAFNEETAYRPNSPYSASKAAADHLVRAWHKTYGLPAIMTNCSNNYGPYQFPEKLIPLTILAGAVGHPLPVYGDGMNVRDWLYVEDHCRGLRTVLERGAPGETYNIGGRCEKTNTEVVHLICDLLDELRPAGKPYRHRISFVADRPGHDRRYAIDPGKIERELGWRPTVNFEAGMRKTVQWYLENQEWCRAVARGLYQGERLGLAR